MGMKTVFKATILFALTGLVSACSSDPLIVDKNWVPKRMVGYITELEPGYYGSKLTRVVFKNGKEMKADLVELQFIGQLAARDKPPFNIFSGRRGPRTRQAQLPPQSHRARRARRSRRHPPRRSASTGAPLSSAKGPTLSSQGARNTVPVLKPVWRSA